MPHKGHSEQWAESLDVFLSEWTRWNDKINLTSEKSETAVIERHIFDSLQYARAVKDDQGAVMDIGSGAGFPGIPLKVIFPGLFFVLVESQRKRANFLRSCVRSMDLQKIEVLNQRAEEISSKYFEKFDLVLFRAVGEISYCLKMATPFLKVGGQVVIKKEPEASKPESLLQDEKIFEFSHETLLKGGSGATSKLMVFNKRFT
ncbi:MAG: hypothetical protein NPINA01_18170 [Nitrospinaceae bacterium]|nr:MAG: hypothetical protein NPINA01_18170 [Nitrospinaceae bacterium]